MIIETASWGWPQWTLLILMFLGFIYHAGQHGNERLETAGVRKGQPERYNAFMKLASSALLLFILIAGGFFQ
jgi:hypothetical protein